MKTFKEFLIEEMGGSSIANTVANVQGMQTEPVIRRKTQLMYFRRNALLAPKPLKKVRKKNG